MMDEGAPTARAPPGTGRREETRAQARRKRAANRETAAQNIRTTAEQLEAALAKARRIMTDKGMIQLLYTRGVQSIPRALAPGSRKQRNGQRSGTATALDGSLEFVIAWTFLFPLFKRPEIAAYLETAWPGFTLQMKDAFIAVVVEGPFPHAVSGQRGRRHQADYHANRPRPVDSTRQTV